VTYFNSSRYIVIIQRPVGGGGSNSGGGYDFGGMAAGFGSRSYWFGPFSSSGSGLSKTQYNQRRNPALQAARPAHAPTFAFVLDPGTAPPDGGPPPPPGMSISGRAISADEKIKSPVRFFGPPAFSETVAAPSVRPCALSVSSGLPLDSNISLSALIYLLAFVSSGGGFFDVASSGETDAEMEGLGDGETVWSPRLRITVS